MEAMNSKQILWTIYMVLFMVAAVGGAAFYQSRKISAEREVRKAQQEQVVEYNF